MGDEKHSPQLRKKGRPWIEATCIPSTKRKIRKRSSGTRRSGQVKLHHCIRLEGQLSCAPGS
eukprot:scaffold239919_cov17-Tisochrysis_lutea.AAC.2